MDKRIVFIPFHHSWKWHTEYASQTAYLLSRNHFVICFLWADAVSVRDIIWDKKPFRLWSRPQKNFYLYQPLHIVPFRRFAFVRSVNFIINVWIVERIKHRLTGTNRSTRSIVWLFGFFEPLFVLLPLLLAKFPFYYDCIDIAWQPVGWKSKLVKAAEGRLVTRARWMSVHSQTLLHLWKPIRPSIFLVPAGTNIPKRIQHTKNMPMLPTFDKKQPVIGYIGAVDYRINFSLLLRLAKRNPQWNFSLIGPVFTDTRPEYVQKSVHALAALPNVRFTAVPRPFIQNALSSFDIGIIPYNTTLKFNRYSYPLKLMEYFWAGLPVIATDIYELRRYPEFVTIGKTVREWGKYIRQSLASPLSRSQKLKERTIAQKNSWKHKLRAIGKILEADARQ